MSYRQVNAQAALLSLKSFACPIGKWTRNKIWDRTLYAGFIIVNDGKSVNLLYTV